MSERSEIRNAAFAACPDTGCDWSSFYRGWLAAREAYDYAALEAECERLRAESGAEMFLTLTGEITKLRTERDALAAELAAIKSEAIGVNVEVVK